MDSKQGKLRRLRIGVSLAAVSAAGMVIAVVSRPHAAAGRVPPRPAKVAPTKPTPPPFGKTSDAATAVVRKRIAQIDAEIARLPRFGDGWAGEYYEGDGLGVNVFLALAPRAGFVFQWHGCMGLYDQNYGAVHETPSGLQFDFTFLNNPGGFQGLSAELVPVRWGGRHYLIALDAMQGFCDNVNSGWEPRQELHGFYLLRDGDEKKPVRGFPDVPSAYRKYLLPHPVSARINSVLSHEVDGEAYDWKRESVVTLNVGSSDGILARTKFYSSDSHRDIETVATVSTILGPHECQATLRQKNKDSAIPRSGWTLSTREWN